MQVSTIFYRFNAWLSTKLSGLVKKSNKRKLQRFFGEIAAANKEASNFFVENGMSRLSFNLSEWVWDEKIKA